MNHSVAFIGNLVGGDGIYILLGILILFGAKKIPELAKGMGQAVREFNKAKDEFEREITRPATEMTVQQPVAVVPQAPAPTAAPAPVAPPAAPPTAAPAPSQTLPS